MDAVIHSASTLRYLLLSGRTRLEPLRIFECRRVKWLDHWVTFYALGTSHAIRFEYGDTALTELLTCVPAAVQGHVLEHGGEHFPYTASRTFDNLSYRCRLTPFDLCGRDGLQGPFSHQDQITSSTTWRGTSKNRSPTSGGVVVKTHSPWRPSTRTPTRGKGSEARAPSRSPAAVWVSEDCPQHDFPHRQQYRHEQGHTNRIDLEVVDQLVGHPQQERVDD